MSNSNRESLAAAVREAASEAISAAESVGHPLGGSRAVGALVDAKIALHAAIDALAAAAAPVAQGEPVAWVRFCSDGCIEGPVLHSRMEEVRKRSGAWTPLYAAPASPAGAEREATWRDGNRLDEHWLVDQAGLILAVVAPQSMGGGRPYLAHVGNSVTLGPFVECQQARDAARAALAAPAQQPEPSPPSAVQAAQRVGGATGDTLFRTFMAEAEKAGITHWPAPVAQQVAAEHIKRLVKRFITGDVTEKNLFASIDEVCSRAPPSPSPSSAQPAGEPKPCEACQGAGKLDHRAGGEWPHSAHEFECPGCGGTGEVFAHADNCDDDLCALNGDVHSCVGKVEPCQCCATTPTRDVALSEAPPSRVHILRDKSDPVGEMWLLDSTGKPLGDTGPIRVPQAWHMALRDEKDAIERRLTQPKGRV